MALNIFIDGYNVVWSSAWRIAGPLDQQRMRLVEFVSERYQRASSRNQVTVVFDGRPGRIMTRSSDNVRVVFSYDMDADTWIKSAVDELGGGEAVVVTNDKAIQQWVKGAKAKVMTVEEFLAPPRTQRAEEHTPKREPADAGRINDELKRAWKIPS